MRSPCGFLKDSTVRPISLPRLPLRSPLTLGACQSVAAIRSRSVTPSGRCSSPRTCAFLLFVRAGTAPAEAGLALFEPVLAREDLAWAGAESSLWIAFQIRETAVLRSVNLRTGATPVRLFQISTSREVGQPEASFSNSAAVLNRGSAPASDAEAKAVMLSWLSMVNVLMQMLLGSLACDPIHPSTGRK